MDINDCAKARVIFDEDWYYGQEGDEMAVNDLMGREGMTEEEVRETYTDEEIFEHALDMRTFDYAFEMGDLSRFFAGESGEGFSFKNPDGGNHILVRGSTERWDGTSHGFNVYKDFESATDTSPSRFWLGNVFADCEIDKVWDVNGHLFVSGHHHDGHVTVEMRQLTDKGERLYAENAYAGTLVLPDYGIPAMGARYFPGDENRLIHDLFENDEMSTRPRFMERCFDAPALDYEWEAHGLTVYPLAADAPERGAGVSYCVQMTGSDSLVRSAFLVKDLAEAKSRCATFADRYWEAPNESVSVAGEKKDMLTAKAALAPTLDETPALTAKAAPEHR